MATPKLQKYIKNYLPWLVEPVLLAIAFLTSLTLAPLLRPPFKNPDKISNPNNALGVSADGNFYVLLVIILGALGIFYLLKRLYNSGSAWLIKALIIALLLANFFLVNSLNSPGFVAGPQGFDNFHNGEQLAPTHAWLNGASLYEEIFYLRGAGVDAIIPGIGFKVLGESVGSFMLVTDVSMLIAIASFLILLACLIRNPLLFTGAAVLFYVSNAMSLTQVRDVPVWLTIGLIILLFKKGLNRVSKRLTLVAVGSMSSLMMFVSVDRGVLLFAVGLSLAAVLILVRADKDNVYSINWKGWRHQLAPSLWLTGGMAAGPILPGLVLGWSGFTTFAKMSFIEIPKYGSLLVGMPFPGLNSAEYLIWGPVFMAITTGYVLIKLYQVKLKDLNALIPYTLIFIFGVLCIKLGSNRIHVTKMASVIAPLVFAAAAILVIAFVVAYRNKTARPQLVPPIVLSVAVLLFFGQFNFTQLLQQPTYSRAQLGAYKNLPHSSDNAWISPETKAVRDYIKKSTSSDDKIFAFTSDPIYYFLADRQNPSRFFISWFADPQPYTNELLKDLKNDKPELIVYKEKTWMDAPDNIPMEQRIPEVNKWILDNYKSKVTLGNTTLLRQSAD